MKICITSKEPDLASAVEERFGRARYFVLYDADSHTHECIDNVQNVEAASGAGVQSASNVVQAGCQWVLTGHIGPKAISVLKAAGVRVATGAEGSVSEAVEAFLAGNLEERDQADVEAHW